MMLGHYKSIDLDDIKELTVLIKKGEDWGSGFLYSNFFQRVYQSFSQSVSQTFHTGHWFLTAGHCVYNWSRLNGYVYDKNVEWLNKKKFTKIPYQYEGQILWKKHKRTDLASRFLNYDLQHQFFDISFLPTKLYSSKTLGHLKTGLRVDYFGYDDENVDALNPFPQLKHRKGEIDFIDPVTKILSISGTAVGGFSGGPVFLREITETGLEGGIPRHSEKFHFIGIMIAVSRPTEKGLPRNEIKVASYNLIEELTSHSPPPEAFGFRR